jgi:hypothetical protein
VPTSNVVKVSPADVPSITEKYGYIKLETQKHEKTSCDINFRPKVTSVSLSNSKF